MILVLWVWVTVDSRLIEFANNTQFDDTNFWRFHLFENYLCGNNQPLPITVFVYRVFYLTKTKDDFSLRFGNVPSIQIQSLSCSSYFVFD